MAQPTIDAMVAVMNAAKEGKEIQRRCAGDKGWNDASRPAWNWVDFEYRVKPEPREWWAILNYMGTPVGIFQEKDDAEFNAKNWNNATIVPVREILED